MSVLFHLTMPNGPLAALDAVMQDVQALQTRLPGSQINHFYPGQTPGSRLPRQLWGMAQLPHLRRAEQQHRLHHIFNPDLYPFPALHWLKKPIVYTAVTGLGHTPPATAQKLARLAHTLVLPTDADVQTLAAWGIENTAVIHPGINTHQFTHQPPPADAPFTLMMASAPWTSAQFRSKGVDALLTAAQELPELHIIFLWRGLLADEMRQRIAQAGLEQRVTLLNEQVDVNQILGRVHASIVLADDPALVKAFPHSLLESLVAGKPVLVSPVMALADYVAKNECGVVVTAVSPPAIRHALTQLQQNYTRYQQNALALGARDFGQQQFIETTLALYQTVAAP
ncbi:MAG: glycosyltransferase [Ardenticatenaceae bacterium]|nr:glycosyltransferase [Anaerolineales bacterium]MCB8939527.1 glycosyltransferase [Ardenticatenaceae bacterium]MCB8975055.1 glycosyltransferase [Ardenticatenaceae bacterium]